MSPMTLKAKNRRFVLWLIALTLLVVSFPAYAISLIQNKPGDGMRFVRVEIDPDASGDIKILGDFDNDGMLDVALGGSELAWYRYPDWTKTYIISAEIEFTTDGKAGDIDGDGDMDIIAPDGNSAMNLRWFENPLPSGDPMDGSAWVMHRIAERPGNFHDVEVGDMNGDGRLDIITREHDGSGFVWIQKSPDVWTGTELFTSGGEGIAVGDIDGDGDLDVSNGGRWYENPTWTERSIDPEIEQLNTRVRVADINQDGRMDVIVAPSEGGELDLAWYGTDDPLTGAWTKHIVASGVDRHHTLQIGDMDLDGQLDIISGEMHIAADPTEIIVYHNGGDALSWDKYVVDKGGTHNAQVGDIGADGDLDIVGSNYIGNPPLVLWENQLNPNS